MRYASCQHGRRQFAGLLVDDHLIPLDGITELGHTTTNALLADPPLGEAHAVPLSELELRPVVPAPSKIICVGLNYLDHVGETDREIPEYPVLFAKFAEALVGAGQPILLPPESQQVDYEGELAVVIGQPGRRIAREDALRHVAGYTIANDVTMRDYQYKTHQWIQGKTWEHATPLGPWLVTPDELQDAAALELTLTLNGQVLQHASTAQLMFDVPRLISTVSELVTLRPGDVILTGTPGGVGFRRDPQVFLADGDSVSVEITGIGMLTNTVVAERPPEKGVE